MNRYCIISPKSESHKLSSRQEKIYYIEDYIEISSVKDARELTDKVFVENNDFIQDYISTEYRVTWSWYSEIFQFCINYLEIKNLISLIEKEDFEYIKIDKIPSKYRKVFQTFFFKKTLIIRSPKKLFFSQFKEFSFNLFALIISIFSIIFFVMRPGKNIGTYSGDYIYKNSRSDFRLNHLYKKYKEKKIQYIEFIRITKIKNLVKNLFKRKRFVIYYSSIIFFIAFFTKQKKYKNPPTNFYQSIIYQYHFSNLVLLRSVILFAKLFKLLRITSFVTISFSSRSAHLAIAAKTQNIKTIGIMHGLQQKEYAVYEFMESYNEIKKIGCDVYGVWSSFYLEYFKKYSKIMNTENIFYSGLLRPINNFECFNSFQRISNNKLKVLIISEPLVSVKEIVPYISSLIKHDDIELSIKVRPMIEDLYFEELKNELPLSKKLNVFDGRIEDIANDFDIFMGSNSTAVIEASLFGKISILLETKKFGDYFGMDNLISQKSLLVKQPEKIYESIVYRVDNEYSLRTIEITRDKFFGENKDGVQWILEQL